VYHILQEAIASVQFTPVTMKNPTRQTKKKLRYKRRINKRFNIWIRLLITVGTRLNGVVRASGAKNGCIANF